VVPTPRHCSWSSGEAQQLLWLFKPCPEGVLQIWNDFLFIIVFIM
jgi:hypothetical protein